MGGVCGTYGRQERCIQRFGGGGDLTERDHWEDLGVDDRTILTCVLRKSVGRVCRRLVWQRIGGRDGNFVIAMMKFRVTYS